MSDRLRDVADRLAELEAAPVTSHPEVLDAVHRALVDELDRLAGVVAGDGAGRSPTG